MRRRAITGPLGRYRVRHLRKKSLAESQGTSPGRSGAIESATDVSSIAVPGAIQHPRSALEPHPSRPSTRGAPTAREAVWPPNHQAWQPTARPTNDPAGAEVTGRMGQSPNPATSQRRRGDRTPNFVRNHPQDARLTQAGALHAALVTTYLTNRFNNIAKPTPRKSTPMVYPFDGSRLGVPGFSPGQPPGTEQKEPPHVPFRPTKPSTKWSPNRPAPDYETNPPTTNQVKSNHLRHQS